MITSGVPCSRNTLSTKNLGVLVSIDLLDTWSKVNHLGEAIQKDSNGCILEMCPAATAATALST